MSNKINLEKEIEDSPFKVSIDDNEKIINQSKQCTCLIKINNIIKGTAFFCKLINIYESKEMKVMITNNHVVGENELNQNVINFSYYDGHRLGKIELDKSRITFTNKNLDITIIELKEKDNINNFLKFDNNFIENKDQYLKSHYKNHPLYTLFYTGNKSYVSYGIIKDIQEKQIFHSCSTMEGASGSPVFLLNSQNVIGIHIGSLKEDNTNICVSFKYILSEFLNYINANKNKNKIEKEIICYYEPSPNKMNNNFNNKNKINPLDISYISENNEKSNKLKDKLGNLGIEMEESDERSLGNISNRNILFNNTRNANNLNSYNKLNQNINHNNKGIIMGHNLKKNYSPSNINLKLKNNLINQNNYYNNINLKNQLINNNKNIAINYRLRPYTPSKNNNNISNVNKLNYVNNNIAKNYKPPINNLKNNNNINQNIYQNNYNYINNNLNNNNYNKIAHNPNVNNNNVYFVNNLNNANPKYIMYNNAQFYPPGSNYNNYNYQNNFVPQNKLNQINLNYINI